MNGKRSIFDVQTRLNKIQREQMIFTVHECEWTIFRVHNKEHTIFTVHKWEQKILWYTWFDMFGQLNDK